MSLRKITAGLTIDKHWHSKDLEEVDKCPYCNSKNRKIEYQDVKDWVFHNSTGSWSYWRCKDCDALLLSPRPTEASIGRAYSSYYTHYSKSKRLLSSIKQVLKNEYFSYILNTSIRPRLYLPKFLQPTLSPLNKYIDMPFGLKILARLPKGRLMDVGCGSGEMLKYAVQMGWNGLGLELDPKAVLAGRENGLKVIEGGYRKLDNYPSYFDCIIFSHVIEHVHNQAEALEKIKYALKPGGILLLSCPNSMSKACKYFGVHWRGLEAPRHLAIPSAHHLKMLLEQSGYKVEQVELDSFPTISPSMEIVLQSNHYINNLDSNKLRIEKKLGAALPDEVDFINLICIKK